MKIATVVVTCNRLTLLPRALKSIQNQSRKPDFVIVVSNSTSENYELEKRICSEYGFELIQNSRTINYSGALNSSIEKIIQHFNISDDVYFASLDDDDEWLPDYLNEIERNNSDRFDLLIGSLLRKSDTENHLLVLPTELSLRNFLRGNPGVCGSNTFIKLTTLLQAGCFDEAMIATVDRDLFVRVFQLNPTYKIISRHLVTQYTDNDRERVSTNREKKKESLKMFYYKYQHIMNDDDKNSFFKRAEVLFSVSREVFKEIKHKPVSFFKHDIAFQKKGNYQFVIGFIAGNETLAIRILAEIVKVNIPVNLVAIINNTTKESLHDCENTLNANKISHRIVSPKEWKENIKNGCYGEAFKNYSQINSIPLGRTILHHHLYNETINFSNPVYWIIDDDITFSSIVSGNVSEINLFDIINTYIDNTDAVIGSVSNDPPLPFLSSIRCQLVDFLHSYQGGNQIESDFLGVSDKQDYYYDLSDLHSDHLETPIYHSKATEESLKEIFSGKGVSRKVVQKDLKGIERIVTQRGPNTLVFNRDLLHYYPVINLSVHQKFARRGDLLWVLFNQLVSGKRIIEHTFAIQQNRPITEFNLKNELEKSAYDIIGYSFNKGFLKVVQEIKIDTKPNRPKDIFEKLNTNSYFNNLITSYFFFLNRRNTRFLMNYYRIVGLTKILADNFLEAATIYKQMSQSEALAGFKTLMKEAKDEETLHHFLSELTKAIWTYSNSITHITESEEKHRSRVRKYFGINTELIALGSGSEGIAFTDKVWVYKSYYTMQISSWNFLKEKSQCFTNVDCLEKIECYESGTEKFIKYPYHPFESLRKVNKKHLISLLKLCNENGFVFTNISPKNFIQTLSGQLKLIDYGKSFEPFTLEKFTNSTKRAYLLYKFPQMKDGDFQKITAIINTGDIPPEIIGWEEFLITD